MRAISRVRIDSGGEPLSGRVLEISSSVGSFQTPTRAPTSTEINAKVRIHFDEPWDNPVFEAVHRYNDPSQVTSLHRRNGTFASKRRNLVAYLDKFRGYAVTKYFPQVPYEMHLDARDLRVLIDLQLESGCDIISVPEPHAECSPDEFERSLCSHWEYITGHDPSPAVMPYVSLRQAPDNFAAKLKVLGEHEHDLWCIGVRAASPLEYRPNLMTLSEYSSKDFWVHCSGSRRYLHHSRPYGQLHAFQRFGVDTVSIEIPQAVGSRPTDIGRLRYFDRASVTYPMVSQVQGDDGTLPCDCPMCRRRALEAVVEQVRPHGPLEELPLRLNDAFRVHDVYSSTQEFEATREVIRQGSLGTYFKGKRGLAPFLGGMEGQSTLNGHPA